MELNLANKVVLVGGASRGIGLAISEAFLGEKARVVLTGRDEANLAEVSKDLGKRFGADRVMTCVGDLASGDHCRRVVGEVVKKWQRIDVVVANAGTGRVKPGWQIGENDWREAFDANLWPSVRLVEAAMPVLMQQKKGNVVFILSIVAREGTGAPVTYSAAKAALHNYAKNLSRQVGGAGIRVNGVAPGNILFRGGTWDIKLGEDRAGVEQMLAREVPLNRLGKPEEVAAAVTFLASEKASFITGSCLVVDGGQTRSL